MITKEEIKKRFDEKNSWSQIETIAEELIYELVPPFKTNYFRYRFNCLGREDLEKLGYRVFEIGMKYKDKEVFVDGLLKNGFLYTYNCYFNYRRKIVYGISDYPESLYVAIDNPEKGSNYENLPLLLSKTQYISLIVDKIYKEVEKYENFKNFVNSLIKDEKDFWEKQLEEEKKEEIIRKALEEAKAKGLIK